MDTVDQGLIHLQVLKFVLIHPPLIQVIVFQYTFSSKEFQNMDLDK